MPILLLTLSLLACDGGRASGPEPVPPVAHTPAPLPPSASEVPPIDPASFDDPDEAYTACKARVEGPEADGECTTDADCTATGCSGEVCVPSKVAAELMTTCEVRPCFAVLDACGCHAGRCSWSIKNKVAPDAPPQD
ncbi:MAG: eight-cysteine-cluster domain-containing protein [Alphaproteobacteria bacterium]|nr:eight-cysteine-cluster domain-containing protein [Alphaproteobacteria bacterium]